MEHEDKVDIVAAIIAAGIVAGAKTEASAARAVERFRKVRRLLLEEGLDEPENDSRPQAGTRRRR
jgi:hypothetical protein